MRIYSTPIFDDHINGGATNVYTSPMHMAELASASALRVFAIAFNGSGTSPTLTVELQEAPDPTDERNWMSKTTVISAVAVSTTLTTIAKGSDTGTLPASAFLRARMSMAGTSPRCNLRLWVAGRAADPSVGLGLRPGSYIVCHEKVYDDYIEGTGNVYSNPEYNDILATADSYCLFAITEKVAGTSPTLTVQIEESPDGVQWRSKAAAAEILNSALTLAAQTNVRGHDNGSVPSSGLVRARIALGGTSPEGRVRLWITGRGEKRQRR